MKLRTQLIRAFGTLALVTLGVSLIALWEVRKLGSALYEVAVVRLPSIQGLDIMGDAMTALESSERSLLLPTNNEASISEELNRQRLAWQRFDQGWSLYEPLPQTSEETVKWNAFVPTARAWRGDYEAGVARIVAAHRSGKPARLTEAGNQTSATTAKLFADTKKLLGEITVINYQIVDEAKRRSVASYQDMNRVENVMLGAALGGLAIAACFGIWMGRRISQPVVQVADALSKVAQGDLTTRVPVKSKSEIGQMAQALNSMVEALGTSEARLRVLSDNLPDSVVYQTVRGPDGEMRFSYVSAGIERLLGVTPEAVLRDSSLFYDQVLEEDRPLFAAARESSLRNLSIFNVTARYCRGDGEVRWLNFLSAPRRVADNRVLWDGVATDITQRKGEESELQRLKNNLANIIDSMPATLVLVDRLDTVTQWNKHAEEFTGMPADQAVGQPVKVVLPEFAASIETLRHKAQQGEVASLEKLPLLRNDERQVFDLMLYPLRADGLEGAVLRIENVTERSRIEELMVQTEKMMSLGGLAAGMAHEINNPLSIIGQAAQNIERRISPDLPANQAVAAELGLSLELVRDYFERREIPVFINGTREAVARAAKIVANTLQFGRKSETDRQPALLTEILDGTVDLAASDYDLRKHYDFRSIEIIRDYGQDLPAVPVKRVEIQQVFLNLLKNAAQAMGKKRADRKHVITLRVRREDKYAVVEIEDNGPGMEEKVARRVFEPFFTTKSPGIGTGLGLSVSYMIITQNHQGFINVSSSAGKGTVFTIKLPLAPERTT